MPFSKFDEVLKDFEFLQLLQAILKVCPTIQQLDQFHASVPYIGKKKVGPIGVFAYRLVHTGLKLQQRKSFRIDVLDKLGDLITL